MKKTAFICTACGIEYEPSENQPTECPVCTDDRQYVPGGCQSWTTLTQVNQQYKNIFEKIHDRFYALYTTPHFAIGQRAHLILSPSGNILWDCITNIDDSTVDLIQNMGGIKAIAISHPHYFSTIAEWSERFGNIPVYINRLDAKWLGRKPGNLLLWENDEKEIWDGIKLIRCGGHFPGSCVLHYPHGKGSLFVGDTIQVNPTQNTVSFMYSYPNLIPLPKKDIVQINDAVKEITYDAMYGAFGKYIQNDAKKSMQASVKRYLQIFE
ncbi:MAG TPA: hypothetical protein VNS32_23750 [Flavisolibacter sp.]|nr:hypothetical protein [Flavisolibacter sp.]